MEEQWWSVLEGEPQGDVDIRGDSTRGVSTEWNTRVVGTWGVGIRTRSWE